MKVSRKAYYGLRAVIALTHAGRSLSIHALAESEHLPEDYLEKILQTLRKAGIVEAMKGTSGGYALVRSAGDINVWDILSVLDGGVTLFDPPVKGSLPCFQVSHCQTNQVWRSLEEKIKETLSDISLEQLSHNTR